MYIIYVYLQYTFTVFIRVRTAFKCFSYQYSLHRVPNNSRNWVYCNGLRQGTESDFDFLFDRYVEHNTYNEKILILQMLGCTPHQESLNRYIKLNILQIIQFARGLCQLLSRSAMKLLFSLLSLCQLSSRLENQILNFRIGLVFCFRLIIMLYLKSFLTCFRFQVRSEQKALLFINVVTNYQVIF